MRFLVLAMLLVAAVGAAAIYRVRRAELDSWLGRPRAAWVARGLVSTSVVAMVLIGLGLPLAEGFVAVFSAFVLLAVAGSLGAISWLCVPDCLRGDARDGLRLWVGPTLGYVSIILLAAYLVRPVGWGLL